MRIAYVDVFQNLPANSGTDWYTLQLLTDLTEIADVTLYHTQKVEEKSGFLPANHSMKQAHLSPNHSMKQAHLSPTLAWSRVSARLDQLRPEMLFDASGVNSIEADVVFARVYSYHIARHIAKVNDAPIVVVMHNVEWEYLKNEGYTALVYAPVRLYEHYVLKRAAAVTTLSPADYAFAKGATSAEKVFYVPYEPNGQAFSSKETSRHDYGQDKLNALSIMVCCYLRILSKFNDIV